MAVALCLPGWMTKWTLRRWSCCCGPLRGGNLLSFAPSMRLSSAVAAGPVPASLSGRRRKWSIRLDRGLEATAARRWTGAGGSGRPCRIRRSCAAVVAQVCVSARPGRQPRESGTRLSPSGNVAARPWSGLTIGARTSKHDWRSDLPAGDSPAMEPQGREPLFSAGEQAAPVRADREPGNVRAFHPPPLAPETRSQVAPSGADGVVYHQKGDERERRRDCTPRRRPRWRLLACA